MELVLRYGFYIVVLILLAIPLGAYMGKVMNGERVFLSKICEPCENLIYKIMRVKKDEDMTWKKYLASVLIFSLIGFLVLFLLQIFQFYLPGNPEKIPNMSWHLSFNTAVSFVTNTNWQAYSGEYQLSYLSQALGLATQNFVSAATGIAVLFALIRAFVRVKEKGLGSFWVDLTRIVLYILLPLNLVISLALVSQGVVQNIKPAEAVQLLEPIAIDADGEIIEGAVIDTKKGTVTLDGQPVQDAQIVTEQFVPMGPAASQIAIKQSGTNGGGYNGVNSAHPLENPTWFSNLVEMISLLLIPAALCFTFGRNIKDKRQGRAIFTAMLIMLIIALSIVAVNEQAGTPQLANGGSVLMDNINQAGGNMEGKESRFGIVNIHNVSLKRLGQLNARQLYTAWGHDYNASYAAWRGCFRRNGLRTLRYACLRNTYGIHCRTYGRQNSRIPWKENRALRNEMGGACLPCHTNSHTCGKRYSGGGSAGG